MATKDKKKKQNVQLPPSIISFYKKYRNTSPSLKTQIIMGSRFDIDDRYENIDISPFLLLYKKLAFFFLVPISFLWKQVYKILILKFYVIFREFHNGWGGESFGFLTD